MKLVLKNQEHHKQRNKNKVSTVVDVCRVEVNTTGEYVFKPIKSATITPNCPHLSLLI